MFHINFIQIVKKLFFIQYYADSDLMFKLRNHRNQN